MDLLQTVRKEGSRGGRAEFSWENVKGDAQRENYLGHSVMAPVGRWQKNKDLGWYANAKGADGKQLSEADARKEEIRKIKEAEEDALARALGYDVPPRVSNNPNMTELGSRKEVDKAIKESMDDDGEKNPERGLGFKSFGGALGPTEDTEEVMVGTARPDEARGGRRREGERRRRSRSRSRDRDRNRHRERRTQRERPPNRERRMRSRSRSGSRRRHRSRSRDHRQSEDDRRGSHRARHSDNSSRHERASRKDRSRSPRRNDDRKDTNNREGRGTDRE